MSDGLAAAKNNLSLHHGSLSLPRQSDVAEKTRCAMVKNSVSSLVGPSTRVRTFFTSAPLSISQQQCSCFLDSWC